MKETHSIDALVVTCIDHRFVGITSEYLAKNNLDYDLIAYPGASKSIYLLFDAIAVSIRLHTPKKIMIIDHEDCGAFGDDNSIETHQKSLSTASKLLNVKFPLIPVEALIAKFDGVAQQEWVLKSPQKK